MPTSNKKLFDADFLARSRCYQTLKNYCSFAWIAAAFPVLLSGDILIRLAIAHQLPKTQISDRTIAKLERVSQFRC